MVSSRVGARMECKRALTKEGNGEFWGRGEDGVLKEVIKEGYGEFWGWGEDGVLKVDNKGTEW